MARLDISDRSVHRGDPPSGQDGSTNSGSTALCCQLNRDARANCTARRGLRRVPTDPTHIRSPRAHGHVFCPVPSAFCAPRRRLPTSRCSPATRSSRSSTRRWTGIGLGAQQQSATQPSDLLILYANQQTADKVIGLAFEIARANAELLSSEAGVAVRRRGCGRCALAGFERAAQAARAQRKAIQDEIAADRKLAGGRQDGPGGRSVGAAG